MDHGFYGLHECHYWRAPNPSCWIIGTPFSNSICGEISQGPRLECLWYQVSPRGCCQKFHQVVRHRAPSLTLQLEGSSIVPYRTNCVTFIKGSPCARTPCPYAHKCNKPCCGRDYPGSGAPSPSNPISSRIQGLWNLTVNNMAPATAASSFEYLATPVNVLNLHRIFNNHLYREFVNKLCLKLRKGAMFGYAGPTRFRFFKEFTSAT